VHTKREYTDYIAVGPQGGVYGADGGRRRRS
jgi:hypothetical protein